MSTYDDLLMDAQREEYHEWLDQQKAMDEPQELCATCEKPIYEGSYCSGTCEYIDREGA